MSTYGAQQPGEPKAESGNYVADQEAQARKRTAIGLSPHRPTARNTVQRPPNAGWNISGWWLVFCLVLFIVAVAMVLAGRLVVPSIALPPMGAPGSQSSITGQFDHLLNAPGYSLWLADEFTTAGNSLQDFDQPAQVSAKTISEAGVYRMEVQPGQIGWSLFDLAALPVYRLETSATLAPAASAGLIGRFAGEGNFYLFTIDGEGQYAVQVWKDGESTVLQPATATSAINPAGEANEVNLEDDGAHLRFYVNQALLYEVAAPQVASGRAGIATLATGDVVAIVDFDWLAIYARSR